MRSLYSLLLIVLLASCASKTLPSASATKETAEVAAPDRKAQPTAPTSQLGIGEVFSDEIETIQFGIAGLELTNPITDLGGRSPLQLSFDVLDPELREYRYTLTHCNADWQPSQLLETDYLSTFTEGDIVDFDLSYNNRTGYTHYRLELPNQYMTWTKSGNYLLNVYDDYDGEMVMRLRFAVVEPVIGMTIVPMRPSDLRKDKTHQEFDVSVSMRDIQLENPRRSLKLMAMQNGDWRTGLYDIPARFVRNDNLVWDYQDKIVFPAGREWRTLDLRTLQSSGGRVAEIVDDLKSIKAYLAPDPVRVDFPFETRIDLNGKFIIENFDGPRGQVITDSRRDTTLVQQQATAALRREFDELQQLRADYAEILFTLKTPRDPSIEPLYLYGAFTNYRFDESTRGVYNELTNAYVFKAFMKQGFYNYAYVGTQEQGFRPDFSPIEGNTFQTENEYQFLLYYRPYGERYDRLISYETAQLNR